MDCAELVAEPVPFQSVETTSHAGTEEDLKQVIDGVDVGSLGWSVGPRVTQTQAAVFRCAQSVKADQFKLSFIFLSKTPNAFFQEFAVSATDDPNPTMESRWEAFTPTWYYAIGPKINLAENNHLRLTGEASASAVHVDVPAGSRKVTAFRVDVFPAPSEDNPASSWVGRAPDGDFRLTEFRVEASNSVSTNVALACPVKASHPVYLRPEVLTDGRVSTYTSPVEPRLGTDFFFEIDLRSVRTLDHLVLKNRIDGLIPDMLSQVRLELFETPPGPGVTARWKAYWRADGSYPEPGVADVIRARDGKGSFRGRFLRISSDSHRYGCPQIAEVEAYESFDTVRISVQADGRTLEVEDLVSVPAGIDSLNFDASFPVQSSLSGLPVRRRLVGQGYHEDWRISDGSISANWPCPSPGVYEFQAQVRHTDGEWNEAAFRMPVIILPTLWQRPAVRIAASIAILVIGVLFIGHNVRRRLARRVADLEGREALHKERTRIARDMHDVVGARLTQLAVMHDIFAAEHILPESAVSGLERLKKTARESVAALDGVVWAVNPSNDTLPNLADYLAHCASEYLTPLNIECLQDMPADWPPRPIGAQARHQLFLAFQEALQNVAKHSAASETTLTLHLEGTRFVVRLEDNGCGLPENLDGVQKDGLASMRSRLASVGGESTVSPRAGGGTTVEMRLPL